MTRIGVDTICNLMWIIVGSSLSLVDSVACGNVTPPNQTTQLDDLVSLPILLPVFSTLLRVLQRRSVGPRDMAASPTYQKFAPGSPCSGPRVTPP
jgi:hypothetical protein